MKARISATGLFARLGVLLVIVLIATVALAKPDQNQVTNSVESITENTVSEEKIVPEPEIELNQPEYRIEKMRVTAYCPCEKCCGQYADGITASGHHIQKGDRFIAADPALPFDTQVIIPGYRNSQPVKVLDRGGAIKGNKIDVFFPTHEEALQWGVQNLEVMILIN